MGIQLNNPTWLRIVCCFQEADNTAGAQMAMCGGSLHFPLDDIFQPSAEDMIDGIMEHMDGDDEM